MHQLQECSDSAEEWTFQSEKTEDTAMSEEARIILKEYEHKNLSFNMNPVPVERFSFGQNC